MAGELDIVTFKWHTPGYRAKFTHGHVNTLQRMVERHFRRPHRFVCFTDDPSGLNSSIDARPMWEDLANVPNPTGGGRPSCYRRLKLFAPEVQETLAERFLWIDVDCVLTGDVTPLWDRHEDIVLWENPRREWPYNGAMLLAKRGSYTQLWSRFDPRVSPRITQQRGYRGSDQAWISHCLGWGKPVWTQKDGVYYLGSIPHQRRRFPPNNCRILFTTAGNPPWNLPYDWIKRHYR